MDKNEMGRPDWGNLRILLKNRIVRTEGGRTIPPMSERERQRPETETERGVKWNAVRQYLYYFPGWPTPKRKLPNFSGMISFIQ